MKNILVCMFILISYTSLAARLVAKNPNLKLLLEHKDIKVINNFQLNGQRYYGIEVLGSLSHRALEKLIEAEDLFRDLPIELIKTTKSFLLKPAWHVTALHYAELENNQAQGQGIVVAIMDTGVDHQHLALKNKMWKNLKEIAGNKIDDDHNGYIDDVYGYNFVDHNSNSGPTGGEHGTHCAGIVASAREVGGVAMGIAPRAKIMSVRIINPENEQAFMSDTVEAIKYAVDNGANILSNSWRVYKDWGYYSPEGKALLKEGIKYAEAHKVIFVAAAGNEEYNNDQRLEGTNDEILPAGFKDLTNMVVVASSDEKSLLSSFSNFGKESVTIAAPGSSIRSTVPGNKWEEMSGTSMATPLIAGVLARGLSAGMGPQMAIERLKETADQNANWLEQVQSGLVNIVDYLK